ncbi:MAG: putative 2-aminoethylphosphonate ABC transporter ATP-binding protein [Rubrivivax sp.]
MSTFLKLEGIRKQFGSFTALQGVDLAIDKGEFVCFLGPSGCGKTTLLRIIAGLEAQTAGRIEQAGRDISRLPPALRDYGIVFQSYALFPNLSVADNVAYGLVNRKVGKAEIRARVSELVRLVGLPGSEEKFPAQLSGGQQQRIALARALATSPGLLLLDEPLSALDAIVRVHLRQEIRSLQRKLGVTTIMVTHDQEEALSVADRIVVMNHGRIEQVGTPMQVYRDPASPFVADFVGKVNVLPGQVRAGLLHTGALAHALRMHARPAARLAGEDLLAARRRAGAHRHRGVACGAAADRGNAAVQRQHRDRDRRRQQRLGLRHRHRQQPFRARRPPTASKPRSRRSSSSARTASCASPARPWANRSSPCTCR